MTEQRFHYHLLAHQQAVLNSQAKVIFVGMGVGAGKTETLLIWLIQQILNLRKTPTKPMGLIAANSYQQVFTVDVERLLPRLNEWGLRTHPNVIPRKKEPWSFTVFAPVGPVEILVRSLDAFELISGVELAFAAVDEAYALPDREPLDLLRDRLRSPAAKKPRLLICTTLDDVGSWMHEYVVTKKADDMDVFYAPSWFNPYLPEDYVPSLKAGYPELRYRRMVCAEWVAEQDGLIYYAFSKANVRDDLVLDPRLPICWSLDFNIGVNKPMSSVIFQRHGIEYHVLDEIVIDGVNTQDVIREFGQRYRNMNVIVYGDASGKQRDTRGRHTDYDLLYNAGYRTIMVPDSNPEVRERHNRHNALLQAADGTRRLFIHPRCTNLITGHQSLQLGRGARYLDEQSRYAHVCAALGYALHYCERGPSVRRVV